MQVGFNRFWFEDMWDSFVARMKRKPKTRKRRAKKQVAPKPVKTTRANVVKFKRRA